MKKINSVKTTMIFTLVILFAWTGAAMAGFGGRGMGPGGGFQLKALMALDLDDSQKEQIEEMIQKHREDQKDRQQSKDGFREQREKLRALAMADEFDPEAFRQAFREMATVMEETAVARATLFSEVKKVLTPEQLDALKEKQEKFADRRGKHRRGPCAATDEWLEKDAE